MGFKIYTEDFKHKVAEAYNSGMKISDVAKMFGVSTSAVSSWASGKKDKRLIFSVDQKKEFVKYRILIYDDTWGWVWRSPLDYVPVEVENE